jgi:hypothetical protein
MFGKVDPDLRLQGSDDEIAPKPGIGSSAIDLRPLLELEQFARRLADRGC